MGSNTRIDRPAQPARPPQLLPRILARCGVVELVMLRALDVAPPATKWGAKEVGIDWLHHFVYAAVTSVV